MSFNFEEVEEIKILVGVKYEEKDEAKKLGCKWDVDNKNWSFKYLLKEFLDNENIHTFKYKPYRVGISNSYGVKNGEVERVKMINICFELAKNRNLKFLENLKSIN